VADIYRVLRSFPGQNGRRYQPDELVEAGDWRNVGSLVAGRLLERYIPPPQTVASSERRERPARAGG